MGVNWYELINKFYGPLVGMATKKRRIATEPLRALGGGPRSLEDFSYLQLERLNYKPRLPPVFHNVPEVRFWLHLCFGRV